MKKILFFPLVSIVLSLLSCTSKDEKRFKNLQDEVLEISQRIDVNNDTSEENYKRLIDIHHEIISLSIVETRKAYSYYYLAWHDNENGYPVNIPDYDYIEKAAVSGFDLCRLEIARKYLNDGQNDKAYQIIQNPDSIAYDSYLYDDVIGVLYYEGATGLPKDINKACDRLALGTISSVAQVDSGYLYPDLERRRQLYAGHLNLIKYIDKKYIKCGMAHYYIPHPQGVEYYALTAACLHYESAKKLGSDFPLLDEIIRTLSTFIDTYDYYKESGEIRYDAYYIAENDSYWRNGVRALIKGEKGIYLDNMYVNSSNPESTGYLIRDAINPSIKAIEIQRFDDHFEGFLGDIEYDYIYWENREVYRSGFNFNSSGDVKPFQAAKNYGQR